MNSSSDFRDGRSTGIAERREKESGGVNITVVRDAVFITALGFVGMYCYLIMRVLHFGIPGRFEVICASMFAMMVGYTLSACFVHGNRWLHLLLVAAGVWIIGAGISACTNFHFGLVMWSQHVFLPMLPGGTLSYIFKRDRSVSRRNP